MLRSALASLVGSWPAPFKVMAERLLYRYMEAKTSRIRPGSNVELHMSRTQCKLGKSFV